jgi:hypothetical protein
MQELLNVKAAGTYSDHSALKGIPALRVLKIESIIIDYAVKGEHQLLKGLRT